MLVFSIFFLSSDFLFLGSLVLFVYWDNYANLLDTPLEASWYLPA